MEYIHINNWENYQHYKTRNPPWIKFYAALLDNYEYGCLQDASKLLLTSLYLIASRTDNKIPNDLSWIKRKTTIKGKIDIEPLLSGGFISLSGDASEVLADCKHDASIRREEKRREETEKKEICGQFQNVNLTEKEIQKLNTRFGEREAADLIETLSEGLASKSYKYTDHYATILSWARRKGIHGKQGDGVGHDNLFLQGLAEQDKKRGIS